MRLRRVAKRLALRSPRLQGPGGLFAECVDKAHFDPVRPQSSIDEQAFEQVVVMLAASNRPGVLRPLVPGAVGVLSGTLERRICHVSAASPWS